jgi:hypothetical protein
MVQNFQWIDLKFNSENKPRHMGCPEHNNMDVSEFSFHLNLIILGVGWLASSEK